MPRWHHSDSSSERYQEVKSIKTFYAAHISRSQAKSMFGNWTTWGLLDLYFLINFHTFLIRVETGGEEEAQKRKTDLSCGVGQNYFLVIFSLFRHKLFCFCFFSISLLLIFGW